MTNLINQRLDKYIVWDSLASNNEEFAVFSQVDFWQCDGCGTLYSYQSEQDFRITTDFSSFESNLNSYYCATKCEVHWDMG